METQNTPVPALERALNILEYLARVRQPVQLNPLAKELDIPISSAFRLVKTLENRGYLERQGGEPASYCLGERLVSLAATREQGGSLSGKADPYMRDLAAELGQTVQLAVIKNGTLMYIAQALSPKRNITVFAPLYTPLDVHTSASGKILFAYLDGEQQRHMLETIHFTRPTANTITDPERFTREATASRSRGYGLDSEEYAEGIGCLSVPIFCRDTCVAALGITGPIAEYRDGQRFQSMLRTLQDTADRLSRSLFFCEYT